MGSHASEGFSAREGSAAFKNTHWSDVVAAGDSDSPRAAEALEQLCRTYWFPLYAYVRRNGNRPEDAQDLVQAFFARLLEKGYLANASPERGKFRTFLLTSLQRFVVTEWRKLRTLKRGAKVFLVSWDEEPTEQRYLAESQQADSPEKLFEKRWALALLDQVLAQLEAEQAEAGKQQQFAQFKVLLWGEHAARPHLEVALDLGLTESALKVAVHRLRKRYRKLLRDEVAKTVVSPAEIDEELRYLIAVLST